MADGMVRSRPLLVDHSRRNAGAGRIDRLMVVALSYILWFALIPLLNLL
jgi:hypothetical protein